MIRWDGVVLTKWCGVLKVKKKMASGHTAIVRCGLVSSKKSSCNARMVERQTQVPQEHPIVKSWGFKSLSGYQIRNPSYQRETKIMNEWNACRPDSKGEPDDLDSNSFISATKTEDELNLRADG
jgi:hypothetical protein